MVRAVTIAFLSDYGLGDEFVGVCHGVIARRCPEARVIDITNRVVRLQSGYIYHYAFVMLIGVALLITYFIFAGGGLPR